MGKKWLFTGDAPIAIEKKILERYPDIDCDILKIGHHGSDTSSSYDFLKAVSPEVAIISVGAKNSYGHPSASVLERLDALEIPYRRTDKEGTITYQSYFGQPLGTISR
jgi:competence protein ComEC